MGFLSSIKNAIDQISHIHYGNYTGMDWTGGTLNGGFDLPGVNTTDNISREHDWDYRVAKENYDRDIALGRPASFAETRYNVACAIADISFYHKAQNDPINDLEDGLARTITAPVIGFRAGIHTFKSLYSGFIGVVKG